GLSYSFSQLNVDYVVTMDADGQHLPSCVCKVIDLLIEDKLDLVVGKRPRFARFSEYLYSVYFSWLFNISDPLCGLKGYSKKSFSLL
uniref:glycosyltransferase n=1 Tax=Salmonella sp. ZJHZ19_0081 TaxID=3159587 RepID=UPI00397E10D0